MQVWEVVEVEVVGTRLLVRPRMHVVIGFVQL